MTESLENVILINKILFAQIISYRLPIFLIRKNFIWPIIYSFRLIFLKTISHDYQSHQMEIRQSSLYYASTLKAAKYIRKNQINKCWISWIFVACSLFNSIFQAIVFTKRFDVMFIICDVQISQNIIFSEHSKSKD